MVYLKTACQSIYGFSMEQEKYELAVESHFFKIKGRNVGEVFTKSSSSELNITINFLSSSGCKVFIGNNVKGNIRVFFKGNNSNLYIGNDCKLNDLEIRCFQHNDFVAIGNGVTTTAKNVWISGHGAGSKTPAIIIGDDCMFSKDIVLRNSDSHPIYSLETEVQINEPSGILHIEPHVWIGEQVSILKSVEIGACSIVALGSIVTKNIPRFSLAKGSPAKAHVNYDMYWARNNKLETRNKAKSYMEKYRHS